ncbi:MAG: hypothetical protein O3A47_07465 [Chloroflexi bacterium]|nr:hypothetical protein [Chloroflexota bacterium]
MADLFEQFVSDYLTENGYLTKLNVGYCKADGKGSNSDIDVLAMHGKNQDVIVGDCKSWQGGFSGDWILESSTAGAERERGYFKPVFREECAQGLKKRVNEEFGVSDFVYKIFCARRFGGFERLTGERTVAGNPIEVVTLQDIVTQTVQRVKAKPNQSVEPTTLGRMVQLLLAADVRLEIRSTG